MNLPNFLTVLRFFLTIGFIIFARQNSFYASCLAALFFSAAAITDFWDGYFARKLNLFSDFGKIMDPIADKFLILSALYIYMRMHIFAEWMFYVIAVREISVTISRLILMGQGKVIVAAREGKLKTVLQMGTVFLIIGIQIASHISSGPEWLYQQGTMFWWFCLIQISMFMVTLITLYSGLVYFGRFKQNS